MAYATVPSSKLNSAPKPPSPDRRGGQGGEVPLPRLQAAEPKPDGLLALRLAEGWRPLLPSAHFTRLQALAVDARCCWEMICGGCGRKGMEADHLAGPADRYTVVARCPECGFEEDF